MVLCREESTSPLLVDRSNCGQWDTSWADVSTLAVEGTWTEGGFHLVNHLTGTLATLSLAHWHEGEVNELCTGEQVCRAVRAGSHTCATADAGCVVQSQLSGLVVHVQGVCIWSGTSVNGDVATLLHDAVQGGAVDDHVLDDRNAALRSGSILRVSPSL